jgi:hypothetical protein
MIAVLTGWTSSSLLMIGLAATESPKANAGKADLNLFLFLYKSQNLY